MKRILFLLLLSFAVLAPAQEATVISPVSQAKYTVDSFTANQNQVSVTIAVKDSGNNTLRYFAVVDNDTAGFLLALDTVRATETGVVLRRANFRILGRLSDVGLITGVTLAP